VSISVVLYIVTQKVNSISRDVAIKLITKGERILQMYLFTYKYIYVCVYIFRLYTNFMLDVTNHN